MAELVRFDGTRTHKSLGCFVLSISVLCFSAAVFNSGRLRVSPVCVVVMSVGIVDGELSVL